MNDRGVIGIWSSIDQKWWFLIAADETLPEGDYVIRSLIGEERSVDVEALQHHVVPREVAQAYLSGQVRDGLQQIKDGVMGFLQTVYDRSKQPPQESRWNVDFLADLLDQEPQALKHDPQATKDGLRDLFYEAALFFKNVKADDEARQQVARDQMRGIVDILRHHGIEISNEAYDIPDILAEAYRKRDDKPPSDELC